MFVGAGRYRAVVVVQSAPATVRTACVRFREPSITGLEALRRSGFEPTLAAFAGEGAAVCSIDGKGCPGDRTCLTCGGDSYWSYHRAAAGATAYTYADRGSSAVAVHDGDVEGWRWGPGDPPPLPDVCEVCGDAVAATLATGQPEPGGDSAGLAAAGPALLALALLAVWLVRLRRGRR